MPERVRGKLVEAAAASGRSLNEQIDHLLEEGLERAERDSAPPVRGSGASTEGRGMSRRQKRRAALALGASALLVAAVVLGVVAGGDRTAARAEMPAKLGMDPEATLGTA